MGSYKLTIVLRTIYLNRLSKLSISILLTIVSIDWERMRSKTVYMVWYNIRTDSLTPHLLLTFDQREYVTYKNKMPKKLNKNINAKRQSIIHILYNISSIT